MSGCICVVENMTGLWWVVECVLAWKDGWWKSTCMCVRVYIGVADTTGKHL